MLHCGYAYFAGFWLANAVIWEFMVNARALRFFRHIFVKNIYLLLKFAGIVEKLHVEVGFCGKELDLYIVILIELHQYIELQNSELAISHMNFHFFP